MAALLKRPIKSIKVQTLLSRRSVVEFGPSGAIGNNICQQYKFTDAREYSPNALFGSQKCLANSLGVKPVGLGQGGCRWMSTRSGEYIDFKLMDHHEYKFKFMFRPFKFVSSVSRALVVMNKLGSQFDMQDFLSGSKQAIMHISQILSAGNFKDLAGLVNPETVEKIKTNYRRLPPGNKALIAVNKEDLMSIFVYEMRVEWLPKEKKNKVEADVVASYSTVGRTYHSLFKNPLFKSVDTRSAIICNYTFVRLFPDKIQPFEPMDDGWTVDKLNHFKILSLLYEMDKGDIPPKQEE